MKSTLLMFLTLVTLTGASFAAAGNGDIGSVGDRQNAEFLNKVEMDEYYISAEGAKSVDVLVDYEMIEIDCHGVTTLYQATEAPGTHSIFVQKQYLPTTKNICIPRPGAPKMAQSGLKLTIKSRKNSLGIFQSILVPAGSKVEYTVTK